MVEVRTGRTAVVVEVKIVVVLMTVLCAVVVVRAVLTAVPKPSEAHQVLARATRVGVA
jgi:hypothetical protein